MNQTVFHTLNAQAIHGSGIETGIKSEGDAIVALLGCIAGFAIAFVMNKIYNKENR